MSDVQEAPAKPRGWLRPAGLLVILFVVVWYVWRLMFPTDMQGYTAAFDQSVGGTEPAVAEILAHDPDLRATMLRETKAAYDQGGWPAATSRFVALKYTLIQNYASDRATLACADSYVQMARTLRAEPALCRASFTGGPAALRMARLAALLRGPCDDALRDGARRRAAGEDQRLMSQADYNAAFLHAFEAPTPLSAAERAAMADPAGSDDAMLCQGGIKLMENIETLPTDQAARYMRTRLVANVSLTGLSTAFGETVPPALHYPAAGTVFTLSMQGRDGKPITWRSLGQDGWDCRIHSSATGDRPLWGLPAVNPIRLLWPLAVGKTKTVTDNEGTATYHVAGRDRYWLPFGWVEAYAIDITISTGLWSSYVMTMFWSPELGFKIGQHTRAIRGRLPDDIAPDWQLIDMRPPA